MEFHYMLMACHSLYYRKLMEELADTELSSGQPKVLDYLNACDGASQKEIAAHCYIEPASLTSVLNGMEAKELIERRRMNGDRRSYHIFLTKKGREQQIRVAKAFAKVEEDTFLHMPEERVEQLMELFTEVYGHLTKEQKKEEE